MSRRPPGHVAGSRKCNNLVWTALLLPFVAGLAVAGAPQQQIRQPQRQQSHWSSPPEGDVAAAFPSTFRATATAALTGEKVAETPHANLPPPVYGRKNTLTGIPEGAADRRADRNRRSHKPSLYENYIIPNDASAPNLALELPAAADSVRAPSLPYAGPGEGLSSQQTTFARRLEDWAVEDFVLLATIDGDLYASDRKDGRVRWHLEVEQPMVETKHFRTNASERDDDFDPIDHYIWVVEPNRDGGLYLWVPHDGNFALVEMPYTMKQMVANSPFADKEQDILYTGKQETTLVTLDAATGRVLKWFDATGQQQLNDLSCLKPTALAGRDDKEECSNLGIITLGRTEYTLNIRHPDGRGIAQLKYSEWGPNVWDNDLIRQHHKATDHQYITSRHDGQVLGFDMDKEENQQTFSRPLGSPVARVFDVLRRWDEDSSNPDLTVLPQPPPPFARADSRHVLVNQTNAGSWYAMSGVRYPLILQAPTAPIHTDDWSSTPWDMLNEAQISKALIGTHPLPTVSADHSEFVPKPLLTLPGPQPKPQPQPRSKQEQSPAIINNDSSVVVIPYPEESSLLTTAKRLPEIAVDKVFELVSNPAAILMFVAFLLYFRKDLKRWYKTQAKGDFLSSYRTEGDSAQSEEKELPGQEIIPVPVTEVERSRIDTPTGPSDEKQGPEIGKGTSSTETTPEPEIQKNTSVGPEKQLSSLTPTVTIIEPVKDGDSNEGEGPNKKKAHRGRRGGVKHRKGKRRELSTSRDDDPPEETVEEVINKAKNLGLQPRLEPDIQTVTNDVEEISGPILRMGSLEVNEDQQLGTGSNGTVVFAGKFDGRDVAVKRMLIQFTEIASQETKLLRESDDHPNVIRYFAQQQRAAFLYIALELCQASLADVVQRPSQFRELALAGERDIPAVLWQVSNGLSHLHSLRIVHRDLKPQNILVNMGKNGKPRLLVSDFGLCKKLEGTNSSFGATTAHAAGTSGWRAPELLLDDNTPAGSGSIGLATADPGSSSLQSAPSVEQSGAPTRRVTRAIDIFSLGLVFFYVLTKGNHPFDCGDRYMREVNIRKGKYSLQGLDVLGDFAFEARDLIGSMLDANPRARPSARDVMAHPFFWPAKKRLSFLCDVSDHFEKEPREPPSAALQRLENQAAEVLRGDFLRHLPKEFVDSLGKQRKYTGSRLLDLLRALRNKRNHYEDMPDTLKKTVGSLPEGYLGFWTRRFPNLLITCWNVVYDLRWDEADRFKEYYEPQVMGEVR